MEKNMNSYTCIHYSDTKLGIITVNDSVSNYVIKQLK